MQSSSLSFITFDILKEGNVIEQQFIFDDNKLERKILYAKISAVKNI